MKNLTQLQHEFDQKIERVYNALQSMTTRERYLVIFTTLFLVVTLITVSLVKMHRLADAQEKRVNDLKNLMVFMQTNAVTMKPERINQLSVSDKIQTISQQQGLAVVSQPLNNQVQIQIEHPNYAVIANFLTQMTKMGISIKKMEMTSQSQQIKLTAIVQ